MRFHLEQPGLIHLIRSAWNAVSSQESVGKKSGAHMVRIVYAWKGWKNSGGEIKPGSQAGLQDQQTRLHIPFNSLDKYTAREYHRVKLLQSGSRSKEMV